MLVSPPGSAGELCHIYSTSPGLLLATCHQASFLYTSSIGKQLRHPSCIPAALGNSSLEETVTSTESRPLAHQQVLGMRPARC
ncbi:hypothetical protein HispidOSU_013891 [Sigmodon hispidus]